VYIEKYEANPQRHEMEVQHALFDLILMAHDFAQIEKFTGRKAPTVIT
jgi:phosphoglucomutase